MLTSNSTSGWGTCYLSSLLHFFLKWYNSKIIESIECRSTIKSQQKRFTCLSYIFSIRIWFAKDLNSVLQLLIWCQHFISLPFTLLVWCWCCVTASYGMWKQYIILELSNTFLDGGHVKHFLWGFTVSRIDLILSGGDQATSIASVSVPMTTTSWELVAHCGAVPTIIVSASPIACFTLMPTACICSMIIFRSPCLL